MSPASQISKSPPTSALSNTSPQFATPQMVLLVVGTLITSLAQGFMLVGVPWLIVQMPGGTPLLGAASFLINILIFFSGPLLGAWMDRHNRKTSFVGIRVVAALGLVISAALSHHELTLPWAFICTLTLVNFVVTFDQSARVAYAQSLLDRSKFRTINTIFELQNQAGNLVVGASMAMIITHLSPQIIMWGLMSLFFTSGILLALLPGSPPVDRDTHQPLLTALRDAAQYLKTRPRLAVLSVVSFAPYICVQTGNFLVPVLLAHTLNGTVEDFALFEISFALGAIGVALSARVTARFSPFALMLTSMSAFTLWYLSQIIWPSMLTIIWFAFVAGWGNSTVRIARNSWLMDEVPVQYMARVLAFLQTTMIAMKIVALGLATWFATSLSPWHALAIIGVGQVVALGVMVIVAYLKYQRRHTAAKATMI
ncbi:MFS transporter [Maritalea myrionectae]|uniref:MFS transporter n=1 Tax=Maritalea myrionectae TaxID=454601 RepID=UPI000426091E|nr:MFS transporter [Maritalea myrionectae]